MLQEFLLLIIGFSCRLVDSQVTSFNCFRDSYAYVRPDNSEKRWNEAQTVCRNYKATLPIIDNPQRQSCFAAALGYFQRNRNGGSSLWEVWLGASSSGGNSNQWQWLDGSIYNGTIPQLTYKDSYAYVTIEKSPRIVTILPSAATTEYYYICFYSTTDSAVCKNGSQQTAYIRDGSCFVMNNETLSWFNARNRCLSNGGDLASFPDINILYGLIDYNWYTNSLWKGEKTWSDPHWIGLRSIWWNWNNAVTRLSMDVTFTRWNDGQPDNEYYPRCITTVSTDYSRWKNNHCDSYRSFICQVKLSTSTPVSTQTTSTTDSTSSMSLKSVSISTPETETSEAANDKESKDNSTAMLLGIGLGIGMGISLILALIVVTALFCRRRQKRREVKQHKSTTSKSEGISGKNSEQNSVPLVETTSPECTYAIVKPMDKSEEKAFEPSYTPIEYAKLDFNKDDTYQNIN